MAEELKGRRIAVLATDGFEQSELTEPVKALKEAGAEVDVVSPKDGQIQGMKHNEKGDTVKVEAVDGDLVLAAATPEPAVGARRPRRPPTSRPSGSARR